MLKNASNAVLADSAPDEGKDPQQQQQQQKPSFPIQHVHFAALIEDVHTEFLMDAYADCIFVLVTQTGKPGTTVRGTADAAVKFHTPPSYDIQPVLGRQSDAVVHLIARELLVDIAKTTDKALLLSVALNQENKTTLNTDDSYVKASDMPFPLISTVVDQILRNKVWT